MGACGMDRAEEDAGNTFVHFQTCSSVLPYGRCNCNGGGGRARGGWPNIASRTNLWNVMLGNYTIEFNETFLQTLRFYEISSPGLASCRVPIISSHLSCSGPHLAPAADRISSAATRESISKSCA